MAEASKEFDKYLRSTLGGQTDADLARLEQTRVDDFHKMVGRVSRKQKPAKRRGKFDFDSEESEAIDSEDSEDDSDDSDSGDDNQSKSQSSETESSGEEPVPVTKPVKGKKEGKGKKGKKRD